MKPREILIADDDPLLCSLLAHRMEAAGRRVQMASDGGQALAMARTLHPDLIVLDAMMPVVDGFEVLRRLKADPQLRDIPVIMLTALKQERDIVGALKLGAADYLVKPFIPDELNARIQRLLPPLPEQDSDRAADRHSG